MNTFYKWFMQTHIIIEYLEAYICSAYKYNNTLARMELFLVQSLLISLSLFYCVLAYSLYKYTYIFALFLHSRVLSSV